MFIYVFLAAVCDFCIFHFHFAGNVVMDLQCVYPTDANSLSTNEMVVLASIVDIEVCSFQFHFMT